jgi:hypothetical protein
MAVDSSAAATSSIRMSAISTSLYTVASHPLYARAEFRALHRPAGPCEAADLYVLLRFSLAIRHLHASILPAVGLCHLSFFLSIATILGLSDPEFGFEC